MSRRQNRPPTSKKRQHSTRRPAHGAPGGRRGNDPQADGPEERLQKRMARLGVASRRESERYITAGRVRVNGKTVTVLGTKVTPRDRIEVDGVEIEAPSSPMVIAIDKPEGVVCTRSDPEGRETIYDLLDGSLPFMAHVGRLDIMTSGLLLMTTDGDLARDLLDPGYAVPRVYQVKVRGVLDRDAMRRLEEGVALDGLPTRPAVVEKLPSTSKHDWLQLTLFEGKNRHVRRILESVGHSVTKLRRIAFGTITLAGLRPGTWRPLEPSEIARLRGFLKD